MMPIMEDKVATITAQIVADLGPALSPQTPDDPLVQLRGRELDIKEEDTSSEKIKYNEKRQQHASIC